jgi:hypothetical protein
VGELLDQTSGVPVSGSWTHPSAGDDRWWAFAPAGNALQPNTAYVLRLVDLSMDSTNPARQKYSMSFETGTYTSLPVFVLAATKTSDKTLYSIGQPPVLLPAVRKFVFSVNGGHTIDWDNVTGFSLLSITGTFEFVPSTRRAIALAGPKFGGASGGTIGFGDWMNSISADALTHGQPIYLSVPDPIQVTLNHRYEGAVTIPFPKP